MKNRHQTKKVHYLGEKKVEHRNHVFLEFSSTACFLWSFRVVCFCLLVN